MGKVGRLQSKRSQCMEGEKERRKTITESIDLAHRAYTWKPNFHYISPYTVQSRTWSRTRLRTSSRLVSVNKAENIYVEICSVYTILCKGDIIIKLKKITFLHCKIPTLPISIRLLPAGFSTLHNVQSVRWYFALYHRAYSVCTFTSLSTMSALPTFLLTLH